MSFFAQDVARQELRIAAQQNVRSAAGHVGCDRDGALSSGLGDDFRFLVVVLGVQDDVFDARSLQHGAELFRSSIEIVPTSTGWPFSLHFLISLTTASNFSRSVR